MFPTEIKPFDGTTIHCWATAPSSVRQVAKILLVHGLGTHSNSLHFGFLREHLTGKGYAVYGFDLRGFGRAGGRRAFVNRWRDFREDLRMVVDAVARDGESLPLFLIGVSLGGLIAANYVVHHPEGIEGLIAIAPALDASGVPTWRRMLLRGLSKVVPTLALKPGLHDNFLTRDQDALRKFTSDPLRQKKLTLRLASESIAAMTETLKMLPAMKLPLLVLHGAEDKIIPPVAGRMLHRLAGSADKEYHEYEGAYHVLTMEINREEVFEEISNWIARRTRRIVKGPSHESNETRAC